MGSRRAAKVALVVVIVGVIAAIYFSPLRQHLTREDIRSTVTHLRGFWYGPIVFIILYAIGCVFALPASLFVLGAGAIWGWMMGAIYSIIGGTLGATASFFAGRFIGEGLLERFGRVGQSVLKKVDHAGFQSLLILRFIPGIPFAALNYGAGVARVRTRDFVLATLIGAAPAMFVFAYCADALINGTMTEGDALKRLAIVGALMIGLVALTSLIKRSTRHNPAE